MSKGTKLRNIRAGDDIWLPAKARAEREGTNLSAVVVAWLAQYGSGGPVDPERPTEQDPDHS